MSRPLRWDSDGCDLPQREASRFVTTPGLTWRVVQCGSGPVALLLHGTGASAHSWRDVIPLLADDFTIIAPDLPGHGFTTGRPPGGLTLPAMAAALAALMAELDAEPALLVGHSAGAAIALELARTRYSTATVVGLNAALMPFPGLAARLFPALAKLLFVNPLVPRIFAKMAGAPGEPAIFLRRSTGSQLDAEGLRLYRTLLTNSRHCDGALEMMANWDLTAFASTLGKVANPVLLVHGKRDSAIPLHSVEAATARLPDATLEVAEALGHLGHEEDPRLAARHILDFARTHAIIGGEMPA